MKTKLFFLFSIFFFWNVNAQIVNIPDANFKAKLLKSSIDSYIAKDINYNYIKIDENDDGEIQVSEAEKVFHLDVASAYPAITSLKGIESFRNLKTLSCGFNEIITLDLSNNTELEWLGCEYSSLTNLNVINNKKLKYLDCSSSSLKAIDVSGLEKLETLDCMQNKIESINVNGAISLKQLLCSYNLIKSMDLASNILLERFECTNNDILSLDLSNNSFLKAISIMYNENLTYLNIKNGNRYNTFSAYYTNLKYLCCDNENVEFYRNNLTNKNLEVNSYCSFNPGGNYNTITGKVSLDLDNNGCTDADKALEFVKLKIENGTTTEYATTFNQGTYYHYPKNIGTFTITPILENENYIVSSAIVNFTDISHNIFTQNFCVTPNNNINDLNIQIIPLSQARPGFDTKYQVIYKNKGTTTLSGNVLFAFNDDKLNYISSDIVPNSTETGKLFFNFTDLKPFEEKIIIVFMQINPPTDANFPVNGGDILSYSAQVFPIADDETPRDNTFALRQEVVNSFDPNDKTCLEGDVITPELVGNDVHYLIRFENVGTANAVNVVVKDIIDTAKFDVESLQPIKSSHPYRMTITEGNKVEFFFENIQLPFDDANNDGYILFKIKTKPTLFVGDTFSNKADIYFDYNFPIATNEAITTVQNVLGTQEFSKSEISIFPNPTKDVLNFKTSEKIRKAEIYDLNGRLLKVELGISNNQMNVSALKTGTYVIKVISDKKYHQTKFIKQ